MGSDDLDESGRYLEALLRVERAQEGREAALATAEGLLDTLVTLAEVVKGSELNCLHETFNHDCAPCTRREVLQIIKQGVERTPH